MSDDLVSIDEFMTARKDFMKGDTLMKASRAASSWNPEKRSLRFVMSSEVEDRDRDIVYQDGLDIQEFEKNPVGFFNHRSSGRPHGSWSDIEKVLNGRPKRTEGTFTCAPEGVNPDADALALDMGAGLIKACSIGFIPKTIKKRPKPEEKQDDYYWPGYFILEATMVECSPCTVPSNPAALAKSAASGNVLARELLEEVLDTWARHPETGLIIPRSEFEAAYKDAARNRTQIVFDMFDDAMVERFSKAWKTAKGEPADGQTPSEAPNDPPQPESPPAPAPEAPATPPAPPADPDPAPQPPVEPEAPLTEEQKDGLLQRLWKMFSGQDSSEDEARKLAEQRRKDAEEAVRVAAMDEVKRQVREAEKSALQHEIRSTLSELETKGLV